MTTSFMLSQPIKSFKDQDRHLKQAVKNGDATHEQAREDMKNRWKHPKQSMDWYSGTKKAFAALPED